MATIKEIQTNTNEESAVKTQVRTNKKKGGKFSFFLFLILIILGVLYYKQYQELSRLKDPVLQTEYAQKQVEKVIEDMKKYVVIPTDEELKLLGVISNAETMKKDQPFYANVENGDYIFLFSKTARALIWRPQDKKVVNFGVADLQSAQNQAPVQSPAPKEPESKDDKKTDN